MILAMILWGVGWPALKIVTQSDLNVMVITFWRFFIMFLAFLPIFVFYRKPLAINAKVVAIAFSSAALNIAFMLVSYWGVALSNAHSAGVIITTLSPVFTLILAVKFLHVRLSRHHYWGMVLGLLGGVMMLQLWEIGALHPGELMFVLSALIWAVLTLISQKAHYHLDALHYSFLLSIAASVVMFVLALPYDLGVVFEQDARFWQGMLFLAVMGQTVASSIYFVASGRIGSSAASSYMFLVPLTALVSSYLILEEIPDTWLLSGGLLASVAVYVINKKRL